MLITRRDALRIGAATAGSVATIGAPKPYALAASAPAYPAYLTSKGLTDWHCVFNPDFTLPVSQLVGPNCSNTPFSYHSPPFDGGVYAENQNGQGYRQTGTGLELLRTPRIGSPIFTVDHSFVGQSWNAPVYFEGNCVARYGNANDRCMYTFWTQCVECYNPEFGGTPDAVGAAVNRGELDLTEVYLDPQWGKFDQTYASTIIPNTEGTGPAGELSTYGLNQPHSDPNVYNVRPSPVGTSLWNRPVTWGALWTPENVTFSRDNIQIGDTYTTPWTWTNPLLSNGQPQSFWFAAFIHNDNYARQPRTFRDTMEIRFMRVWKP
jgi:hypothetical protein